MNIKEIRKIEKEELEKKVQSSKKEIALMAYDHALGKVKDTSKIKKLRKDIARFLTILKEKEILQNEQ